MLPRQEGKKKKQPQNQKHPTDEEKESERK